MYETYSYIQVFFATKENPYRSSTNIAYLYLKITDNFYLVKKLSSLLSKRDAPTSLHKN